MLATGAFIQFVTAVGSVTAGLKQVMFLYPLANVGPLAVQKATGTVTGVPLVHVVVV